MKSFFIKLVCVSFFIGIAISAKFSTDNVTHIGFVLVIMGWGLFLTFIKQKNIFLMSLGVFIIFFSFGFLRFYFSKPVIDKNSVHFYQNEASFQKFIGEIVE